MDIPADIPISYQPVWEGVYQQAIGEGVTETEATKKAWDCLELIAFEAQGAYQPSVKYDGKNKKAVMDDINANRATITDSNMTPEDVLKLYNVPPASADYKMIYAWLERNMFFTKKYRADKKPIA
jgi:hypothetical protein